MLRVIFSKYYCINLYQLNIYIQPNANKLCFQTIYVSHTAIQNNNNNNNNNHLLLCVHLYI